MKPSHATDLVALALREFELFHDRAGEGFATTGTGPRETLRLDSERFRRSLARDFYREASTAPSEGALSAALATLGGMAMFDGPEHGLFLRVAGDDGRIYLDLADSDRRAVEIGPDRWRVISEPPVRFLRPPGMLALPEPVPGGSLGELPAFLNLPDEESFRLVAGFLLGVVHPSGPYPLLSLSGEQGSAKSTAAAFLRDLVDPNAAGLRSPPADLRDLAVATRGSRLLAFDNVSHIGSDLSDALCRLATGGAFATRRLYTDAEEVTFEARRPVIITSIPEVVTSSDLAERTLTVPLRAIRDDERLPEAEVRAGFEEARPRLLGALCGAASCALANLEGTRIARLPRMADLARWVTAAEPALGWEPGAFLAALTSNRTEAAASALESSPIARCLVALAEGGGFEGTATDLLAQLEVQAGAEAVRGRYWPKSARALSSALRRLAPDFGRFDIDVDFGRAGHEGRRVVRIARAGGQPPSPAGTLAFPAGRQDSTPTDVAGVIAALEHAGFEPGWDPGRMAALALQKAWGNAFLAARALNGLSAPAPGPGGWTAVKVEAAVSGEGSAG